MIKTQHCPNCEATEQKLHDFRQEVSDAVEAYDNPDSEWEREEILWPVLAGFIIPKPKPDPLVEVLEVVGFLPVEDVAEAIRVALNARGLEIREKNDGQ